MAADVKTDWLSVLKKQAHDPESIMNEQMEAEFADVMRRAGQQDSATIETLRKLTAEKLVSGQIAVCARKRFTQASNSFSKLTDDFPISGDPITDLEIDQEKATAANLFHRWEVEIRLLEALAKGRAFTLDAAVAAVANAR